MFLSKITWILLTVTIHITVVLSHFNLVRICQTFYTFILMQVAIKGNLALNQSSIMNLTEDLFFPQLSFSS